MFICLNARISKIFDSLLLKSYTIQVFWLNSLKFSIRLFTN